MPWLNCFSCEVAGATERKYLGSAHVFVVVSITIDDFVIFLAGQLRHVVAKVKSTASERSRSTVSYLYLQKQSSFLEIKNVSPPIRPARFFTGLAPVFKDCTCELRIAVYRFIIFQDILTVRRKVFSHI